MTDLPPTTPGPAPGPSQADTPHEAPPARVPDPGTPASRALAVLLAIVCAAAAILWQNQSVETQYHLVGKTPPAVISDSVVDPMAQPVLLGRVYVRMDALYDSIGQPIGPMAMPLIEDSALTPAERIVAGIAAGVLLDDEGAIERLQAERDQLLEEDVDAMEPEAQLRHAELLLDTKHLLAIYRGEGEYVSDDARDRLVRRYGYFGQLATTHQLPDSDPARAPLLSGGMALILVLLGVMIGAVVLFIAGSVVLLMGWMKLASGRMRMAFRPPAPGGSVFLEVYALFVGGFLAYAVLTTAFDAPAMISLAIQWSLLLVPFWPLLRGVDRQKWAASIGLHRGRGVLREIGAGLTAYLAAIPLFFMGVGLTLFLMLVYQAVLIAMGEEQPPPPSNPVIEILDEAGPIALVMIFLLATVWAPLTEELVFRGALHRALRARVGWVLAGLVGALLFAFMHGYGPLFVSPLVALGFMFSFMREWRGSLIACITAHFVHNATVLTLAATLIYLIF